MIKHVINKNGSHTGKPNFVKILESPERQINKQIIDEIYKELSSRKNNIMTYFGNCVENSKDQDEMKLCFDYINHDFGVLYKEFSYKLNNSFYEEIV